MDETTIPVLGRAISSIGEVVPTTEFLTNIFAVIISILAVVIWIKLYSKLYTKGMKESRAWTWLFIGVLGILLFNISSIYLIFSSDPVVQLMSVVGRTIVAISMTVGAYLLYSPMEEGKKYEFVPIKAVAEKRSYAKMRHRLDEGKTYLVNEERPTKSNEIFVDLVTHGINGLYITRQNPEQIRKAYDLERTPIIWLTREKTEEKSIEPTDLVELSHTMKEFIKEVGESVIMLDGLEYLIVQNGYKELLQFMQSLKDSISMSSSRLVVPLDPSTIDTQQLHLLKREMNVLRTEI